MLDNLFFNSASVYRILRWVPLPHASLVWLLGTYFTVSPQTSDGTEQFIRSCTYLQMRQTLTHSWWHVVIHLHLISHFKSAIISSLETSLLFHYYLPPPSFQNCQFKMTTWFKLSVFLLFCVQFANSANLPEELLAKAKDHISKLDPGKELQNMQSKWPKD